MASPKWTSRRAMRGLGRGVPALGAAGLPRQPIAHVVALQRREAEQRELTAAVARGGVGRLDELDAQERLARLGAGELAARDRAAEVVEQRVEPGDVARVHPVGGDRLALELPLD